MQDNVVLSREKLSALAEQQSTPKIPFQDSRGLHFGESKGGCFGCGGRRRSHESVFGACNLFFRVGTSEAQFCHPFAGHTFSLLVCLPCAPLCF